MSIMSTAQEVIKKFMSSLDNTSLKGTSALDQAVKACSSFNSMQDVIDNLIADCKASSSYTTFLQEKCGIILGNSDTGAITGSDAGTSTTKTNQSIVPESGSPSYPSGTSFTIKGLTVNIPEKSTLTTDQQTVIQGLYSWWIEEALNLIEESYGLSFTESGTYVNEITVEFENNPSSSTLAYVSSKYSGYSYSYMTANSLTLTINMGRFTNLSTTAQSAEEVISKELSQRIINTFDPNIGINRIEDIDLLHDFIRNNEIYKGNKRITFYYKDDIYDMSRTNGSILTNAVFFTKLYSTLIINNIITKILRGRGRQIHTVQIGVSPNTKRYIDNAMAALAMPEHHLGTLHGSFEQILNPFNSASDIVIPTEENAERYITTDYIPGQDVDMNDEFVKFLLNSIITSFGLDSAVIDTVQGNVEFARTWSMLSLQIANMVKNEQQDLYDSWSRMCLDILSIAGNDETRAAVSNGKIEIRFYEPKSLIIQNSIDDLNNAKSLAENLTDLIPALNFTDDETMRQRAMYEIVKLHTNVDLAKYEKIGSART